MRRGIAVIDCETDPFRKGRVPAPFVWGYYNGSEYHQFLTAKKLAVFLSDRDEIVYAHNGGKFDFHYLLDELEAWDDLMLINGRIARCQIGMAELRDSFSIVPVSLDNATGRKEEIDYAIFEKDERTKKLNWDKITRYLKNDCVILWDLVSAFINRFGPEMTVASAAMKQWRKVCDEKMENTDEEFYNVIAPFYYGGRVECFSSGVINSNFSVYDINSAYPYAMLAKHPYSANYQRASGYLRNADFVRICCRSRGSFPFRGLGGGDSGIFAGLSFPRDNDLREFTVTGWEYAAALETKSITDVTVLESIRFMKHVDFKPYIDKFWGERQAAQKAGDALGSLFAKLMMNSLYGKFAANPDNYHNYMICPAKYIPVLVDADAAQDTDAQKRGLAWWEFAGELGPWALARRALDEHEKRYYNVATGASITGYVRAMLWRAIHSSEGVLYCDTDSIAVKAAGRGVVLGDALGQWKHEGDFDRAGIAGKKLYIFRGAADINGKRIHKKASKGARLTDSELWKLARGGSVDYMPVVPTYSVNKAPHFTGRRIVNTTKKAAA